MPNRTLRRLTYCGASIAVVAATLLPGTTASAAGGAAQRVMHRYDAGLLKDTNAVRARYGAHGYRISHRLSRIAHAYARHLAATGELIHNPDLEAEVSRACPAWRTLGENIGVTKGGGSARQLFKAYMHSPEHRANLLDPSYRDVGIATVRVVRHGKVQKWNVMDFANHCP